MLRAGLVAVTTILCFAVSGWTDTLVLRSGTSYSGRYLGGTTSTISFRDDSGATHRFPIRDIQSLNFNLSGAGAGASSRGRESTSGYKVIPQGTELRVRTNEAIDSASAATGQTYSAEISEAALDSAGRVAIPKGSPAQLIIRHRGNSTTGTRNLALDLDSVTVDGRQYVVSTSDIVESSRQGLGANKRTGEMVGGGAAVGALIGAIVGGGKGAGIGAAVGGGGGAVTQVVTRGKTVRVPAETVLRFSLDRDLHLEAAR